MSEPVTSNVKREVTSVKTLEELKALFEGIKRQEPERYARLEAEGEFERQIKVLGLESKKK